MLSKYKILTWKVRRTKSKISILTFGALLFLAEFLELILNIYFYKIDLLRVRKH